MAGDSMHEKLHSFTTLEVLAISHSNSPWATILEIDGTGAVVEKSSFEEERVC